MAELVSDDPNLDLDQLLMSIYAVNTNCSHLTTFRASVDPFDCLPSHIYTQFAPIKGTAGLYSVYRKVLQ